jgi:hypothetical protein
MTEMEMIETEKIDICSDVEQDSGIEMDQPLVKGLSHNVQKRSFLTVGGVSVKGLRISILDEDGVGIFTARERSVQFLQLILSVFVGVW